MPHMRLNGVSCCLLVARGRDAGCLRCVFECCNRCFTSQRVERRLASGCVLYLYDTHVYWYALHGCTHKADTNELVFVDFRLQFVALMSCLSNCAPDCQCSFTHTQD